MARLTTYKVLYCLAALELEPVVARLDSNLGIKFFSDMDYNDFFISKWSPYLRAGKDLALGQYMQKLMIKLIEIKTQEPRIQKMCKPLHLGQLCTESEELNVFFLWIHSTVFVHLLYIKFCLTKKYTLIEFLVQICYLKTT